MKNHPPTIIVNNANRTPEIGDIANAFVDKGAVLEIPFTAADADNVQGSTSVAGAGRAGATGNPLQITLSGLPRFASFTQNSSSDGSASGVIRFAPGAGDRGDYTITVVAMDNGDSNVQGNTSVAAGTMPGATGTQYQLDATGKVTAIQFTDGAQWLVSDAGIAAVTGDTTQRVDFQRDAQGRIVRMTGPVTDGNGTTQRATAYQFDDQDRLILVRSLNRPGMGTPMAYDNEGKPFTGVISANLGAAVNWSTHHQWAGTLQAGETTLAFAVRESELASTVKTPGAQGSVIVAIQTDATDAQLKITGGAILGMTTIGNTTTTLVRVTEAGTKLIHLTAAQQSAATVRITLAGDLNRDGSVNGLDSQSWEQALAANDSTGDLNGDGQITATDRQLLYANYGWRANQAPSVATTLPVVKTHTDLATNASLATIAQDLEGDTVFWRVLDATHGSARLSQDGQTLLFTPDPGVSGQARITVQADDGFAASSPIELTVNVSSARLLAIHLAPLPQLQPGQTARVLATVDFEDQKGVAITDARYLTVTQADLSDMGRVGANSIIVDDAQDRISATANGPVLIHVTRAGSGVQAMAALNVQAASQPFDPNVSEEDGGYYPPEPIIIEPDVYPGTLTLVPGGIRQLKVHLIDENGEQTAIHTARQTADIVALDAQGQPVTAQSIVGATRYLSSDDTIASVDANGLITAHRAGNVTISVVHLSTPAITEYLPGVDAQGHETYTPIAFQGDSSIIGQTDIRLAVQAAQLTDTDPLTPTPQNVVVPGDIGGAVSAATGETVLIGPGALANDTAVSIHRISIDNLDATTGLPAPAQSILEAVAAFTLNVGEASTDYPLQLAIPVQMGVSVQAGDEVLFFRKGTVPDPSGTDKAIWWLVDNGFIGADGIARTASPPYPGFFTGGVIAVAVSTTRHQSTGRVEVKGMMLDQTLFWQKQAMLAMGAQLLSSPGGLGAGLAIFDIALTIKDHYFANYTLDGSYQLSKAHLATDGAGNVSLTLPPPPETGQYHPAITSFHYDADNRAITLQGVNFMPPGMTDNVKLKVWIQPKSDAVLATPSPTPDRGLLWTAFEITNPPANGPITVTLPKGVALSQHEIYVERLMARVDGNGAITWPTHGSASTSVDPARPQWLTLVTRRNELVFFQTLEGGGELMLRNTEKYDNEGNTLALWGTKTDQIVFNAEGTLAFIAGRAGKVYVVDTTTLDIVHTIHLANSTTNITSLAVDGHWLYVTEGASGTEGRLLRVSISGADGGYLSEQQVLTIPGVSAPNGFMDMAMSNKRYLALTAPQDAYFSNYASSNKRPGNVYVVDLALIQADGTVPGAAVRTAPMPLPTPKGGRYPNFITTGSDAGEFLLSNADYNRGVAALKWDIGTNGSLGSTPTINAPQLTPAASANNWIEHKHHQNIQRAQGVVTTVYHGVEYALVADYHFIVDNPLWRTDGLWGKQVGGKIGIIQDPFGNAKYLGATTPIVGGAIDHLSLAENKTLYADVFIEDAGPDEYTSILHKVLFTWDANALIQAAIDARASGIPLTQPIDLNRTGSGFDPIAAAQPKRYDVPGNGVGLGWIYGINSKQNPYWVRYSDKDGTELSVNYGDVTAITREALINSIKANLATQNYVPSDTRDDKLTPDEIAIIKGLDPSRFGEFFAGVGIHMGASVATDPHVLPSKQDDTVLTTQTTGLDSKEIAFYVVPDITEDKLNTLRQGGHLADEYAHIFFTVDIKLDPSDTQGKNIGFWLKVKMTDYQKAPGAVFFGDRPLKNPGYGEFNLTSTVGAGTGNPLDIWRVEQRLEYFGYGLSSLGNNEITVNGKLTASEAINLRQFSQIIQGETDYSADGSRQAVKDANGNIIKPAKPKQDATIRANSDEWKWLNAYNAPHWMQIGSTLGQGNLAHWENKTTGATGMGTSWVYDLMLASDYAADKQNRKPLWFSGTGSLGTQLSLGINTAYISDKNQKKVDGKDIILGRIPTIPNPNDRAWSYNNATEFAKLLHNPNITNPSGSRTDNSQGKNLQNEALLDFVAVYSAMQNESGIFAVNGNGSLDEQKSRIKSGDAQTILQALFGDGTQAGGDCWTVRMCCWVVRR